MKKKISTAIIGSGFQANNWANALKNHKNFDLKKINSSNKERGIKFAKEHNCQFEIDEYKIANDKDIDLVVFSTSPERQKKSIDFANKKKNLILEKPLSLDEDFNSQIYDTCKKNNIICGAGLNRHYDTFIPKIVSLLEKNNWKCNLVDVKSFFKKTNEFNNSNFKKKKYHGDLIISGLVHKFDQINAIFGKPKKLIAKELNYDNNILTQSQVTVEYENNLIANFMFKNDSKNLDGEEIIFYCEEEIIHVNFNLETVNVIKNYLNKKISRSILSRFKAEILQGRIFKFEKRKFLENFNFRVGGQKDILDAFYDAFNNKYVKNLVNIEHNFLSTKMAFACYKSIQSEKWISI